MFVFALGGLCVGPMFAVNNAMAESPINYRPVAFAQLEGWASDNLGAALQTFVRSCAKLETLKQTTKLPGLAGHAADWHDVCLAAKSFAGLTEPGLGRQFFEDWFRPYAIETTVKAKRADRGLFTGYFEPEMDGQRVPGGRYQAPLLRKPDDLERDKPYVTRAEIDAGALLGRGLEIVYLDPVDAFFLHVQGSGRIRLGDGTLMRVGFAAKNGQPYTAIGKVLVERGALSAETVSMQSIRAWLEAHPAKARGIMQHNKSYIFFRKLKNADPALGPIGAQGVVLTPRRSLAVDKSLHSYGLPLWLETKAPTGANGAVQSFNRLMIAQDTGSAITGAVRGDVFWGSGDRAGIIAGQMKHEGRFFALFPLPVIAANGWRHD